MEYTVEKITGRFKHVDEAILKELRMGLKFLLRSWGAVGMNGFSIPPDAEFPLWAEVEFLDNIVQLELECNPTLKALGH